MYIKEQLDPLLNSFLEAISALTEPKNPSMYLHTPRRFENLLPRTFSLKMSLAKGLPMICATLLSVSVFAARFETNAVKDIITGVSGSVHSMLNNDNNTLEIGKEFDELVRSENGTTSSFYVSFNVRNINDIYQLALTNVHFKDHILIKVNDKYVWSSNGKTQIALDTSRTIEEKIKGRSIDEEFKFYTIDGKSVETWDWHNNNVYFDVKPYIRTGQNRIDITLISGINGGFKTVWQLNQKADKSIQCKNGNKTCTSSGEKVVEGVRVTRPCWQYSYEKTCNYPSKDDCKNYAHCAVVADRECLLKDKYGNCVNMKREMSCERTQTDKYDVQEVGFDLRDKNAASRLVCTNFPCIDGSCVNQDTDKNKEMMEVTSKLSAVGQVKGQNIQAEVFKGTAKYCNDTRIGYHDCCRMNGWGKFLGSRCTAEEEALVQLRKENKCIYVGKRDSRFLGLKTVTRNAYCCYPSTLDKIIQHQGRPQLAKNFGNGEHPDCSGFRIEEILKLDFDRMDFGDFYADILKRMKLPKIGDMDMRLKNSMPDIQTSNPNATITENQKAGFNKNQINTLKSEDYGK